jgi:hypothetical protein
MVIKAQKSHGSRSELNSVFGLEKVDRWNPIRTSAIQSRSPTMDGPSAWWLGEVPTTPHRKHHLVTKCHTGLPICKAGPCENGNELSGSIKEGKFLD